MITDQSVAFIPNGAPLSCVGGAAQTFASGIVDVLGQGVGTAPANIIGNATLFGSDIGVGGDRPELNVTVGTAFVGADQTLKAALQAAPDTGAGGGYQPGDWVDVVSQDGLTPSELVTGAVILRTPFLPDMPPNLNPRYFRLLFSPQSVSAGVATTPGGDFSAGTIASAVVTMVRDDQANKFAAANFHVA